MHNLGPVKGRILYTGGSHISQRKQKGRPSDVVFAINPARTGHLRDLVTGYDPVPDCSFPGTVRIVDPDTGEIRVFPDGVPAVVRGRGYWHTGPSTNLCLSSEDRGARSLMNGTIEKGGRYIIPSQGFVALWASHFSTGPIAVGDVHTVIFVGVTGSGKVTAAAGRGEERTVGPAVQLSDKPQNIVVSHRWTVQETSLFAWLWGVDDSEVSSDFKVICVGKTYWDGAYIPTPGWVVSRPSRQNSLRYPLTALFDDVLDILSGAKAGTVLIALKSITSTEKYEPDQQAGILSLTGSPYRGFRDGTTSRGVFIFQDNNSSAVVANTTSAETENVFLLTFHSPNVILSRYINSMRVGHSTLTGYDMDLGSALQWFVGSHSACILQAAAISTRTDISPDEFARYL